MRVALAYDEPVEADPTSKLPEDYAAEFEDSRTIEALLKAIRACGHEAAGIVVSEEFPTRVRQYGPDLVFNIAEGLRGPARESIVPGWLDQLNICYTGSDGLTLALSLDKALTKTLAATRGVRTPVFQRVRNEADLAALDMPFPLFVKPNGEGSSMGIRRRSHVETPEALADQVDWVLRTYEEDCLVETFVPGREFCVGILANGGPECLPIAEIRAAGQFYSYEDKHEHRKQLICPADVPENLADEMRRMALMVFETLRCRDLARVDFKLDADGRPTFLEINPLPGLSPYYSIFPSQARASGISFEEMIGRIIEAARKRTGQGERIAL